MSSDLDKSREKWYNWSNGEKRTKYLYCNDCDFKTVRRDAFEKDVQTFHPLGDAVATPGPPKKRKPSLLGLTIGIFNLFLKQFILL